MANPSNLERLRSSGNLEKYEIARHHLGIFLNVQISATYSHSSSSAQLKRLVYHALQVVVGQHPSLSAIPIYADGKDTHYVRLREIDLDTCVEFVERASSVPTGTDADIELDQIMERQHNLDFKTETASKPFWRIVVLHSASITDCFTLTWIFHHAIGDGTSGMVFHRTFLAALQNVQNTGPDQSLREAHTGPLLPPAEDLHPLPLSVPFLLKQQWREWFSERTSSTWTGAAITANTTLRTTKFRSLPFSSDTTSKLLALSRKNSTTVTATLECLLMAALFHNLDEKYDRLSVNGATSIRRYLKLPETLGNIDDQIGNWVSNYGTEHFRPKNSNKTSTTIIGPSFWSEARRIKAEIKKEVDKNCDDSAVALLRWVPSLTKYFNSKMGKERTHSIEVSNVGVLAVPSTENGWKMGRCVFSQAANVVGAAMEVCVITGADGCAVLTFTWFEAVVQGGFVSRLMRTVEEAVEELCDQ